MNNIKTIIKGYDKIISLIIGLLLLVMTGCSQSTSSTDEDVQAKLAEYAQLIVDQGLNVETGDTVAIQSPIEASDLANLCIEEAYDQGASNVLIYWTDQHADATRYKNADDETLSQSTGTLKGFYDECGSTDALFLRIESPDTTYSEDVDPKKLTLATAADKAVQKEYRNKRLNNDVAWTIVGYPNKAWAELVFPDKKGSEAVDSLLNAILDTVYVTGDGNSSKMWEQHRKDLKTRAEKMNIYDFVSLRYKNSIGTDITVQLPEGHIWVGGNDCTPKGKQFVANMPTEEIYSAPLKTGANGTLAFSKPLVINGSIVEDAVLTLKDGKIVDAKASKGQELLLAQLDTDEGSRYLGEISLVPFDSPISNSGLLFYDTLYDENASCHFAFGSSYSICLTDGTTMTMDELLSHGLNQSNNHIDFMVGTEDLSIIGTTHDGKEVVVFKDGNFAF